MWLLKTPQSQLTPSHTDAVVVTNRAAPRTLFLINLASFFFLLCPCPCGSAGARSLARAHKRDATRVSAARMRVW